MFNADVFTMVIAVINTKGGYYDHEKPFTVNVGIAPSLLQVNGYIPTLLYVNEYISTRN